MSLRKLYGLLTEAGIQNEPGPGKPKKRYRFKSDPKPQPHGQPYWRQRFGVEDEPGDDELGPDMDYDDPSPPEPTPQRSKAPPPEQEPPKPSPNKFASKSEPPSKALQGGKTADTVKADKATLGALQRALDAVRTSDDDLQDWIDDVIREIGRAVRSGGDLTLPKFEATPSLDDFNDDGGSEDEDY